MSEDLVQSATHLIGRYGYLRLGSTNLAQLRRSKYVRGRLDGAEETRKPDGIVFLPRGGIKAVIEVKQSKELAGKKLASVINHYSPIARAVCNVLIITDGKDSYWINPHTGKPILDEAGKPIRLLFDCKAVEANKLTREVASKTSSLIEQASYCINKNNDQLEPLKIVDPSGLTKTVWQKIWINTGKEPEKCLYNVVELFLFKFLSDNGVLVGNNSFQRVIELLSDGGDALTHYANISRKKIKSLFPKGADNTTVINGTIFVNEKGDPNLSQAGLFAEVILEFQAFDDLHGSMRHIDREFKTRLYESFLRQEAGIKSLGQYFTPRNVVQAMVRMSKASTLQDGARICDPFCGVGGFLLETIVENKDNIWKQFRPVGGKITPKITLRGYDKGTDEKDDERTIILAKANMLIYFSDLLSEFHTDSDLKEFSEKAFNPVFQLIRSNLGTFGLHNDEPYDLILTNPPYVTSGSASLKNAIEAGGLEDKYLPMGRGTEALAMQWIVNNLKLGGEALVVVPDGLLHQRPVLDYLIEKCLIRGVVALPSRTFYSTPKKTYILILNRKSEAGQSQVDPVFAYFVSEMGESRDARRVPIAKNDLADAVPLFRQFNASKNTFKSANPRCKIIPFQALKDARNWLIDRSWSKAERAELGMEEEQTEVDEDGFVDLVKEAQEQIQKFLAAYHGAV